jgi:N-acyl-L-homoserine lactone synthetase
MTNGDDKVSYKKIQAIEPFTKYSEADLRQRVCRLRKHLFKEVLKWQKKPNQ